MAALPALLARLHHHAVHYAPDHSTWWQVVLYVIAVLAFVCLMGWAMDRLEAYGG